MKLARRKARLIGKLLVRATSNDPAGTRLHLYSAALSRIAPGFLARPLACHADASQEIGQIAEACDYLSEAPHRFGDPLLQHPGRLPPILARQFTDACISGFSSAIATPQNIAIPAQYIGPSDALITDPDFFLVQENGVGLVRCAAPRPLESGIAVFGAGANNWYHWLIEILPSAFLAERLPVDLAQTPLLVPEPCGSAGTFAESLSLFTANRAQVILPAGATFRVDRLVVIDPVVNGPMNLRAGQWPRVADYSQNTEVLLAYRAAILGRLGLRPSPPRRRIFLARGNDRRGFNQDELIAIAQRHGFEAVYPERMSLREQVQTFAEAETLLGASGAAFANMLFCQPGARGLTWLLPQYSGFCCYSNLARVVGVSLETLFVMPRAPVTSSHAAYSAAYVLHPSDFETALKRMV